MKECPKCKTMLEDDAVYCVECGEKQEVEEVAAQVEETPSSEEKYCIHCGKLIEAGSAFCPYCGKPQDVEDVKCEEPQKKKPKTEKPHTTSEDKKNNNENALEDSVVSMIKAHNKRLQEEDGKNIKSILKSKSYPKANIQLFSDANNKLVLKVSFNESIDGELYERFKISKHFDVFVKEDSDSNEDSFTLDFHNDEEIAKSTILEILIMVYNQPQECAISYVTNVGGYTKQEKAVSEKEQVKKKTFGCGCWIWILFAILLGAGLWYYYSDDKSDLPFDSIKDESITEENNSEKVVEEEEITNAEDFLKKMYDDFYEPYNSDRFSKQSLSKYFSDGALSKFYVEDYYSGKYFYCTDFLVNGCISGGGAPDYGDKVVKRTIENKGNGWYEVTNIWDVINTPVKVRFKVDKVDTKFFITDFVIIENEHESTKAEEVPDEAAMMDNLAKRNIEANNLNE